MKIPSTLEYLGPGPNFSRDSFPTKASMEEALTSGHIDEGHLSYCIETGTTWQALRGSNGDLVWVDPIGSLREEVFRVIEENEKVMAAALNKLKYDKH